QGEGEPGGEDDRREPGARDGRPRAETGCRDHILVEEERRHAEARDLERDERDRRERERVRLADGAALGRRLRRSLLTVHHGRTIVGPASSVRSYSYIAASFSSVTRLPRAAAHAPNQIVSSRPKTKAAIASGASSWLSTSWAPSLAVSIQNGAWKSCPSRCPP